MHKINELKEFEKFSLGWHNLDKNEVLLSENKQIPSRSEISQFALKGNKMIEETKMNNLLLTSLNDGKEIALVRVEEE